MSHFYGGLRGASRNVITRRGHATTGMSAWLNGWNAGVSVSAGVSRDGKDAFQITATGGSNGNREIPIATVTEAENGAFSVDVSTSLIVQSEVVESMLQQLQAAVSDWPQFDSPIDEAISVSGAELVDWFSAYRETCANILQTLKERLIS